MAAYDEDKVFDGESIRDTSNHNSTESVTGGFSAETIFVENGLNQQVTFQLQGARNSVWLNIGGTFSIAATSNDYQTVSDYFPKYRLQAICGTAPTTGVIDAWIIKTGEH